MKLVITTIVAVLFVPFALLSATYYASPCRDAGVNEDWMVGGFDLLGKPRIVNSRVDIGCYESPIRGMRISIK